MRYILFLVLCVKIGISQNDTVFKKYTYAISGGTGIYFLSNYKPYVEFDPGYEIRAAFLLLNHSQKNKKRHIEFSAELGSAIFSLKAPDLSFTNLKSTYLSVFDNGNFNKNGEVLFKKITLGYFKSGLNVDLFWRFGNKFFIGTGISMMHFYNIYDKGTETDGDDVYYVSNYCMGCSSKVDAYPRKYEYQDQRFQSKFHIIGRFMGNKKDKMEARLTMNGLAMYNKRVLWKDKFPSSYNINPDIDPLTKYPFILTLGFVHFFSN